MRNLKRALSLAMASIMLLGMMVMGASAATSYDDFSDKDKIVNTEAVNTMVSLGVLAGRDTGEYDPTGIVTRGEMAKLIAYMRNGGKDPVLGTATANFTDTKGHWAETFIAYCANQGMLNGYGDGTFKPNATVTGTEAAKMILTALGYRSDIETLTGANWALNTNSLANKVHLYDGLTINPNEGLTRDNTAQMIYNGVQAEEVEYRNNYGEYSGVIYAQPNGTMLTNRFNVVKVTGVVLANDLFAVDNGTATQEGKVRLGLRSVTGVKSEDLKNVGSTYTVAVDSAYMGREIVLYVKFQNNLSPNAANSTVLGSAILTNSNVVVETSAKLTTDAKVKDAIKGSGLTIDSTSDNKTQIVKINETGTVPNDAVAAADTNAVQPKPGVMQTFIDNNNDGKVEYIIQENPALTKVSTYNTKDEKLTLSGIGSIDFSDTMGAKDVAKDDYVLVAKYGETYVITKADSKDGTVTSYNKSNNKITVDGTAYAVGSGANKTTDLDVVISTADNLSDMVDNGYTLYLDSHGNVLGAVETSGTIGNYAVITGSTGDVTTGFSSGKVKLLMADGTSGTYDVDLLASAKKWSAGVNTGSNSDKEKAMAAVLKADAKNNVISYTLNDNKTVTIGLPNYMNSTKYAIKTGTMDNTDPKFYSSTSNYVIGGTRVIADSNTVFFVQDANGYTAVAGLSKMPSKGAAPITDPTVVYNITSGSNVAKAIYLKVSGTFTSTANFAYVSDKFSKSVESGDTIYSYPVVLQDGTASTLKTKDSTEWNKGNVYSYTTDSKGYVTFDNTTSAVNNVVVAFVGNGTVDLVDPDNSGISKGSLPLASGAKIWNVEDTDSIYDTSLTKLAVVCLVKNDDGAIKTGFVMDVRNDKQTNALTSATISRTGSGVIADALGVDGGSTTLIGAAANDELSATVKFANTQKATFTTTASAGTVGTVVASGDITSGTSFKFFTAGAMENNSVVTLKITLADKDANSTLEKRVITFVYTVSAAKAAAPTSVTLGAGSTKPATISGTTALVVDSSVDATATYAVGVTDQAKLTAAVSGSNVKSVSLKKDGTEVTPAYTNGGNFTISGDGTYVYAVTMQEAGKLDATYTYTVVIDATQKKATAPTVKLASADSNGLTVTGDPVTLTAGANTVAGTGFVDGTADSIKFTITDAAGNTSTATLDGTSYTAGTAVDVGSAAGTVNYTLVVTTIETGCEAVTTTYTIALTYTA